MERESFILLKEYSEAAIVKKKSFKRRNLALRNFIRFYNNSNNNNIIINVI